MRSKLPVMAQQGNGRILKARDATERSAPSAPGRPHSADVCQQLERILKSNEFIGSDRTRRFLRYVVEETLAGRGDRIKAFSVAVAAFDRDESFDPQTDPIVRIEAGRLRRSLERYYLVAGPTDPVWIEIPRGTYVPDFSWQSVQGSGGTTERLETAPVAKNSDGVVPHSGPPLVKRPANLILVLLMVLAIVAGLAMLLSNLGSQSDPPAADARPVLPHPSVAVLPFGISSSEQHVVRLATGMTNEVIRELSRYSSVFILGPLSLQRFGAKPDVTLVGAQAGVDFVLSGGIEHSGDRFQISVQLADTETGGVIWAETYDRAFAIDRLFDLEVEIARDIVRRIGQPQGAIALFDWKRTRGTAPETWEAYDCVLQADDLRRRVLPPVDAPDILACLKRAVEQEPGYADAWVMLALIEIDELRFVPMTSLSPENLERAYEAAARAVDLAPDSGRAHMAVMMALYFNGQVEAALAAGQVAVQFSLNDPDILAEVGLRHVLSGDVNAGLDLIERAVAQSQTVPAGYQLNLSLGYLRKALYQKASDTIAGLGPSPNFVYWAVIAAIHGKAGNLDKAREAADELLRLYPDFPRWAWSELERRSMAPELAAAMVDGWRAAGLNIAASPAAGRPPPD